jgi:hypothetical protein
MFDFPSAGSIAFVSLSTDNLMERFGFIVMDDIPAGTQIKFTCGSWNGYDFAPHNPFGQSLPGHGGATLTYTVPPGGVQAGTLIQVQPGIGWYIAGDPTYGREIPHASDWNNGLPGGSTMTKEGYWDMGWGGGTSTSDKSAIYAWVDNPQSPTGRTFLGAISTHIRADLDPQEGWLKNTGLTTGPDGTALELDQRLFDSSDVFCISERLVNWIDYQGNAIQNPEHFRAQINDARNWIRDSGVDDGAMNSDGSAADRNNAEGSALTDPNSPLRYKQFTDRFDTFRCFMPGTLIRTPSGAVAVEELGIGDEVVTSEGHVMPVKWIGRQTISTPFADPLRVRPIHIRAGALADHVPSRDLFVSPDHALLVGGILVSAGALVNGISIVRAGDVPTRFTYYHVELWDHALILAENTPAETFIDNVDRLAFDNWAEHEALYPSAEPIREMAYPRAKAARQVPQSSRERLAARAGLMVGSVATAA